uniref:Aquaporin 4 n=1 Tax=Oncorhynchus mykiss TaxID=8022 RepID=A0A8K9UJG1_ONCMY
AFINRDMVMAAFKGILTQEFWRCMGADTHPDLVLISLCFGISIATLVKCFGHMSGAHINPAVTAAMVVTQGLSLAKAVFYLLAQCLGALVGAAVLYGVTPDVLRVEVVSLWAITFELIFTMLATCDPKCRDLKGSAALAIGFSVCIGHLFDLPYTGASVNLARSFGPASVTWSWENHWVRWFHALCEYNCMVNNVLYYFGVTVKAAQYIIYHIFLLGTKQSETQPKQTAKQTANASNKFVESQAWNMGQNTPIYISEFSLILLPP